MPKELNEDGRARVGAIRRRNKLILLPLVIVGLVLVIWDRVVAEPDSTTHHVLLAAQFGVLIGLFLLVPASYRDYEAIRASKRE